MKGHTDALALLLKLEKVDKEDRADEGKTLLHLASEHGQTETIRTLIEHNCDTSATDTVRQPKRGATFIDWRQILWRGLLLEGKDGLALSVRFGKAGHDEGAARVAHLFAGRQGQARQ